MAIDAGGVSAGLYCGQCRAVRTVSPAPPAGHWAYCGTCGGLLIERAAWRRYAGFWRRFAGYWIDIAVIFSIYAVAIGGFAAAGAGAETAFNGDLSIAAPLHFLYLWLLTRAGRRSAR